MNDVIIRNSQFVLTVGSNAIVKSLIHTGSGQECLDLREEVPLCSVTQERPFHNELKLSHPNKKTVFAANSLVREGNRLTVGFELLPYQAVLEIREEPMYVSFELLGFEVDYSAYEVELSLPLPPVYEFRLLQLPVKNRTNFGEWLNVSWDDEVAVNILGNSPHTIIDAVRFQDYRVMYADAYRDVKLEGCSASLIVTDKGSFLDAVACVEEDYDLPKGVQNRRSKWINASAYWTASLTPDNVEEHIRYAKQGGFRLMLLYRPCFFQSDGEFKFKKEYPNGMEDVKKVLDKIRAAGILPGMHVLHTHVSLKSGRISPYADRRLHLKQKFLLTKELDETSDTVYVDRNPAGCTLVDKTRILKVGGELISYESYTTTPPYAFVGCTRGICDTRIASHSAESLCGILDVCEFCAMSAYIDQETDLQDEVAEEIAKVYRLGCGFIYFDGSEGTNAPYEYHIPNAQYKVYRRLQPEPVFAEAAAKSHFGWHMLSGGNAFDIWPMKEFKAKIAAFQAEEAPRMRMDFTRLNFGWWNFPEDVQPDIFEYGTSRAAAWDCPVTMMENLENFKKLARTDDILEVMRRWEDVRALGWLGEEEKERLKNLKQEHILLINGEGEYELREYDECREAAGGNKEVRAFVFERQKRAYAVLWHASGNGVLELDAQETDLCYEENPDGEKIMIQKAQGKVRIPLAGRRYLSCDKTVAELRQMLAGAGLRKEE